MKEILQIESIKNGLIQTILIAVSGKTYIGTFYKNIGEHHTTSRTTEEYSNSPIVSVHNSSFSGYGGYEAATVYDIYIEQGKLMCTLNGEGCDDWDEPIENVQVEGLMCIVAWLTENNFAIPEPEISVELLETILSDEDMTERFADIFFDELESEDEPYDTRMRMMLRAFLDNEPHEILTALTGWDLDTLIRKLQFVGNVAFHKMIDSLYLLDQMGAPADVSIEIAHHYNLNEYIPYYEEINKRNEEDESFMTDEVITEMGNRFSEMLEEIKKINLEEGEEIENTVNDLD